MLRHGIILLLFVQWNRKVYINGTADSTTLMLQHYMDFTDTTVMLAQGIISAVQAPFDGILMKFVSQFARYTSNFTAPTEAFADKGQ